jgi:putative copper resistance protein D
MTGEWLVLARFFHYAALLLVFGWVLFPLYTRTSKRAVPSPALHKRHRSWLLAACLIALVSGIAWLLFTTAAMAGSIADAFNPGAVWTVISETSFGLAWSIRLGLLLTLLVAASPWPAPGPPRSVLLTVLAGVSLASLAATGHTQIQEGLDRAIHTSADAVHLLAAGAWLGGLFALAAALQRPLLASSSEKDIAAALHSFSGMGSIAVAALIASGAINGWYLLFPLSRMLTSLYGQLLILKLAIFAGMLLLAALNRFVLVPRFEVSSSDLERRAQLSRLRRSIVGEQLSGIVIVALVSYLGTLEPPSA